MPSPAQTAVSSTDCRHTVIHAVSPLVQAKRQKGLEREAAKGQKALEKERLKVCLCPLNDSRADSAFLLVG